MVGRRTAAATDDPNAVLTDKHLMRRRQLVRLQVVDHLSINRLRQPRVGRAKQRRPRIRGEIAQRLMHQVRTRGAVETDPVQAKRFQRSKGSANLTAHQHLTGRLNRHRRKQRNPRLTLSKRIMASQDRCLALQQVINRLHEQRVHVAIQQTTSLLEIRRMQLVESNLPKRRKLRPRSQGTDYVAPPLLRRVPVRNASSDPRRLPIDLPRPLGQLILA